MWVAFFFLYVYGVRTGEVSKIMNMVGIDMMGRDYLWQLVGEHYDFSIGYMGHGFEYVDSIVANWYSSGLINHPYPFHNDILKVFVEMGFPGFVLWSGIQYVIGPIFWTKYADNNTALLYMADLGYMTITYLTDNTAFYFWSTMALRMIVLSYSEKTASAAQEGDLEAQKQGGNAGTDPKHDAGGIKRRRKTNEDTRDLLCDPVTIWSVICPGSSNV